MGVEGAAHDDQAPQARRQVRVASDRGRQGREGAGHQADEFAGVRLRRLDPGVGGVEMARRRGRGRQFGVSDAQRTVGVLGGHQRGDEGSGRAGVDGHLGASAQLQPREIVGRHDIDGHIAGRGGHSDEVDVGAREQIDQRE